jgi:palmitoyltransferase
VLFLFYAISYCFTIIGITLKPFLTVWTNQGVQPDPNQEPAAFRMQTILVFMVASVFSLSIFFLFSFHCYLVSKNRTTIEVYGAPTIRNVGPFKNAYNLGCFKNWQQVMGRSMLMWPIPVAYVPRECDGGHRYPLAEVLSTNQQIDVV